jgi:hypothetical protein
MTPQDKIRTSRFALALEHFPPLVRERLIVDRDLKRRFGVGSDAILNFGSAGMSFQRSELIGAIRNASKKLGDEIKLRDLTGSQCSVVVSNEEAGPNIIVRSSNGVMQLREMAVVAQNCALREAVLKADAERVNLPEEVASRWQAIIKERPLDGDEFGELTDDLKGTPVAVEQAISEEFKQAKILLSTMVPRSSEYYDRLVGKVDGQRTIKEFAQEVAKPFVSALFGWRRVDGFKQALLLGSHSFVVKAMGSLSLNGDELKTLIEWAVERGDPLSIGALIELALGYVAYKDKVRQSLAKLVSTFSGEGQDTYDRYSIFSAAFLMVYGELAQMGLLASKPVYWQRLAAMAQAGIITRCVISSFERPEKFVEWMGDIRSLQHVIRCYIDQRTDPMWLPELALPRQLKNELAGRVLTSARSGERAVDALGLKEKLFGPGTPNLESQVEPVLTALNGPLEGNMFPVREIPSDHVSMIREELAAVLPSIESFSALSNLGFLFKIPADIPKMAADALRRSNYTLEASDDPKELPSCLLGLASLSAITRSAELADALFILVRVCRRQRHALPIDEAFRTGIIACASRVGFPEWCKAVGAFITDLSFGELSREEAMGLHNLVFCLCHMVPELWAACGQGVAALDAVRFE